MMEALLGILYAIGGLAEGLADRPTSKRAARVRTAAVLFFGISLASIAARFLDLLEPRLAFRALIASAAATFICSFAFSLVNLQDTRPTSAQNKPAATAAR